MKLSELINDIDVMEVRGDTEVSVAGIAHDSREVVRGGMFVCLPGLTVDGHDYGSSAVRDGATSLVVERWLDPPVPQVKVADSRTALAELAAAWYHHPSLELTLIGITGTNGKTTVAHFLQGIGRAASLSAEVLGTLGVSSKGALKTTGFTTPEATRLQKLFREAVDARVDWVALECSSHALVQKRLLGTRFDVVVFTNLSRDHLDYHLSMDAYFEAKRMLFQESYRKSGAMAVVHIDDAYGAKLAASLDGPLLTYGMSNTADVRAENLNLGADFGEYDLVTSQFRRRCRVHLPGRFNVLNALGAQAAAMSLGVSEEALVEGVARVAVPGRMEPVQVGQEFQVFVDFAHTPDGLVFALNALREITPGDLWVVFGCGGDRDQGKRPLMGATAERYADHVVITSDNPRSEDPVLILRAVAEGMDHPHRAHQERDRERAMQYAFAQAQPGDTVLIAGKGHEATQIMGEEALPFDDREVAGRLLKELHASHG